MQIWTMPVIEFLAELASKTVNMIFELTIRIASERFPLIKSVILSTMDQSPKLVGDRRLVIGVTTYSNYAKKLIMCSSC